MFRLMNRESLSLITMYRNVSRVKGSISIYRYILVAHINSLGIHTHGVQQRNWQYPCSRAQKLGVGTLNKAVSTNSKSVRLGNSGKLSLITGDKCSTGLAFDL